MASKICLDTGPLTLHFTKDEPEEISTLMNDIKLKKTEAYVISPILVEVFRHLCIANGKSFAESSISSFSPCRNLKRMRSGWLPIFVTWKAAILLTFFYCPEIAPVTLSPEFDNVLFYLCSL